jgi:acetylornithine/N-succinyldiaminopimelate aminotransferase
MSATALAPPLLPAYARRDVTFVRGEGAWLVDDGGSRYLDLLAGIAVVGLGHAHPAPLAAARAQLEQLWHASNLYRTQPMEQLAERLSERFGGARAFFANSGAEAIESALKYARKATGKPGVVALEGSFHGRTLGALSATGQPTKRAAFEPLLPGVSFARLDDSDSLARAADGDTGCILIEPVQGEGGVHPASAGFLADARALADELGALLVLDEVQTGIGRTGTFFAFEQLGVRPHLVTMAKALANGLPIGALLVADEVGGAFSPGDHGSTFGGNPVSCAAACAVVDLVDESLLANVRERGAKLAQGLESLPGVREVRGRGLLLGAELDRPAAAVVDACRERDVLVLSAGETTLRLAPPLTIDAEDVDEALTALAGALEATTDRITSYDLA